MDRHHLLRFAQCICVTLAPFSDATIHGGHAEFVVRFDGPVYHIASRLDISRSGRATRTRVPSVDRAVDVLFASGEAAPAGNYLLRWREVSADGEVLVGGIAFSVAL